MSSFLIALASFSPEEQSAIRARLKAWSEKTRTGRTVVDNLDPLEHFLPPEDMKELLQAIYRSPIEDLRMLAKNYQEECYLHIYCGDTVILDNMPVLLGRAVEKDVFINWLYRQCDFFTLREQAAELVQRLLHGLPLDGFELSLNLSEFATWATWSDESVESDPFAFAASSAEKARACLGLDPEHRFGDGLLMLVYERPADCPLYRPTVADAGLCLFFRPPRASSLAHGWTRPWDPGICELKEYEPVPRPEAVHRPVAMAYLRLPARNFR